MGRWTESSNDDDDDEEEESEGEGERGPSDVSLVLELSSGSDVSLSPSSVNGRPLYV